MSNGELSREERLLRLISEETITEEPQVSADEKKQKKGFKYKISGNFIRNIKSAVLNSVVDIKNGFGFLTHKTKSITAKEPSYEVVSTVIPKIELNLALLNKMLSVCILILTGYMFFDLIAFKPETNKRINKLINKISVHEESKSEPIALSPLGYYLTGVEKRDIFNPFEKPLPPKPEPAKIDTGPTLKDIIKDYTLIGFIGGTPRQVMIEGVVDHQTYVVGAGDFIKELEIKEIYEKSILVKYKSEEMEWK